MRAYWRVAPAFWMDEKVTSWSDDARYLALYLLTCPHRSTEGLFRLPKGYICEDLKWSPQRLAKPFGELLADGFIEYDEAVRLLLIPNALEYQAPENGNQVTFALKELDELPDSPLLQRFYECAERLCQRLAERLPERFSKGYAKPPAPTPAPAPTPTPTTLLSEPDGTDPHEVAETAKERRQRKQREVAANATALWKHWQAVWPDHDKLTFTGDRRRAVEARLRESIAPEVIRAAIEASRVRPWWNGAEDGEWKADIKTICGKGSTVENLAFDSRSAVTDPYKQRIQRLRDLRSRLGDNAVRAMCETDGLWQEVSSA